MTRTEQPAKPRRGVTLLEAVVGLAAIGATLVLAGKATRAVDRQWRLNEQERLARETLDHALELATCVPAERLDQERLDSIGASLSPERLPAVELTAALTESDDKPFGEKRVVWTVAWTPHPDADPIRRRLTAWVYPAAEEEP
ncbi:hypothetical protein MalM25_22910 [Planctomycetes bacterium MalM25]|nr:hypothetical protein MalM25_22910 [Planctomycetes bacterium MalM25]